MPSKMIFSAGERAMVRSIVAAFGPRGRPGNDPCPNLRAPITAMHSRSHSLPRRPRWRTPVPIGSDMQNPFQIAFKGMDRNPALEDEVRAWLVRLSALTDAAR